MIRRVLCVGLGVLGACSQERAVSSPTPSSPPPVMAQPWSPPVPSPAPVPSNGDARQRGRTEIVKAMSGVHPNVAACFERFRVGGLVIASTYVAATGEVSKVEILGALAGTPTAECVAEAAKQARFRAIERAELLHFTYPFFLAPPNKHSLATDLEN